MMKNPKTQNQSIEIDSTEIAILETLINTDDYISGSVLAKAI